MVKFQSPTGMRDLLEEDFKHFQKIERVCQEIARFYGFKRIETPILEESALFEKGTGFSTEIVKKQMFNLETKGGDHLVLRPEGTPSIVRAYLEKGMESLPKPVKLWHFGPFFRHERPQAGRYRQFYQAGLESLGSDSWIIDSQIIQIFYNILKSLGFKNLIVEINSIGDSQHRAYYKKNLVSYLKDYRNSLCSDCKRRLRENPLRILDCKQEKCQKIIRDGTPQIIDYLCRKCNNHFKNVLETLEELEISYKLNPYLVRGLDYYTRTVFEIFEETEPTFLPTKATSDVAKAGARDTESEEEKNQEPLALAGGGRYDDLVKLLGGKETPACGGALGVDRIVNLIKKRTKKTRKIIKHRIFLAQIGKFPKMKALKLMEKFRKSEIKIAEALDKDSLSSQLKLADKLKAEYVLILGQKETLEEKIILRNMKTGKQKIIAIKKIVGEVKKKTK